MAEAPSVSLGRKIFIEELSLMIGKAPTTIRTCATNGKYQHLIPRPYKLPHSRRLFWYESDVHAWQSAAKPVLPLLVKRRGRPTKAQQLLNAHIRAMGKLTE